MANDPQDKWWKATDEHAQTLVAFLQEHTDGPVLAYDIVWALNDDNDLTLGGLASYNTCERRLRALVEHALGMGFPICANRNGYFLGGIADLFAYADKLDAHAAGLHRKVDTIYAAIDKLREPQGNPSVTVTT